MKTISKVNDDLSILFYKRGKRTYIYFIENDQIKFYSSMRTLEGQTATFKQVYNYLIFYKYFSFTQHKIIGEVYDLDSKKTLDIDSNIELEDTFTELIKSNNFKIETILTLINKNGLKLVDDKTVDSLVNYVRNDRTEISREQVIDYILSLYEDLDDKRNISENIRLVDYENLKKEPWFKSKKIQKMQEGIRLQVQENAKQYTKKAL